MPTPIQRDFSQRPGARQFWGALIVGTLAVFYALAAAFINPLYYSEIAFTLSPAALVGNLVLVGLGGAAIGLLTMRSESMAAGVLTGAAGIGVVTTIAMLGGLLGGGEVLALIALLPALAFGLVFCALLRLALSGPLRRAPWVWLAAAALGVFSGLWGRSSEAEVAAIKVVQRRIDAYAALPTNTQRPFEFNQAPNARAHLDRPYTFSARTVRVDPITVEVVASFDDGYTLTCRVIELIPLCSELGTAELGGPESDQ